MNTIKPPSPLATIAATLLTVATACADPPPDLTSGFDTDTAAWRASSSAAVLTWQATDGATGAYLKAQGPAAGWNLVSPTGWAGDWSGYRALRFDLAIPSRHYADNDRAGMVVIVGANDQTMTWTGPTPLWTWTHYEISLDPVSFGVDQTTFDGIMASVTEVRILAEFTVTAIETIGLDNVVLTSTPTVVYSEDLVERFTGAVKDGTSLAGWTAVDDVTLMLDWQGQPLHCMHCDDWQDGRTFKVASPATWAGDWSGFNELRFDYKWSSSTSSVTAAPLVRIFGANGNVLTWTVNLEGGIWHHFVIPLVPESFGVDAETFQGVMSYVNQIWIQGEFDAGNDQLYLDNVVVATGPESPRVFTTSVVSRFGEGANGWIVFDGASLTWLATGGFGGGGAITCYDTGTGNARFCSPDSWSGDWRAFRHLRFLLKGFSNTRATSPATVTIYGSNGATLSVDPPDPYFTWCPYTIDLTPETFGVTQPEFDAVFANVAHVTIDGDLLGTNDTTGLDDVILLASDATSAPPPEHFAQFGTDQENWRKGGLGTDDSWTLLTGVPTYRTDGNPGGCIAVTDEFNLTYWFTPEAWAGDWRGYESVSFDLKIISGTALLVPDTMLALISVHGALTQPITASPTLGQWHHYQFALSPAAFGVSQQEFDRIMRDVTMIGIRAEWINGTETEALDNVRLTKTSDAYWLWLATYLDATTLGDESLAGKTADFDSDGFTNWEEYLALTSPTDPLSSFHASGAFGPGGFVVEYQTRSGRVYQVWRTADPSDPAAWTAVGPQVTGDDTLKTYVDPATAPTAPTALFRVGVDLP